MHNRFEFITLRRVNYIGFARSNSLINNLLSSSSEIQKAVYAPRRINLCALADVISPELARKPPGLST